MDENEVAFLKAVDEMRKLQKAFHKYGGVERKRAAVKAETVIDGHLLLKVPETPLRAAVRAMRAAQNAYYEALKHRKPDDTSVVNGLLMTAFVAEGNVDKERKLACQEVLF